ncbi:hypothetical protein G6F42_021031 [Rhizopus arrhizus]|nr:hypothetical protein G6F42_021031 [Rhizopus arrhizus]
MKHTVTIQVQGLSAANEYELEFSLIPVREETLNSRPTQLTVSHVLGEDQINDGSWRGVIMVNGVEANVNSDIKLKALHEEELQSNNSNLSSKSSSHGDGSTDQIVSIKDAVPTDDVEGVSGIDTFGEQPPFFEKAAVLQDESKGAATTAQYMGGGVVATALGNVSAGVNNFGARMMNPFRAASNSFLVPNNNSNINAPESATRDLSSSDDEDDTDGRNGKRRFTREEKRKINSTTMTMHEIRLLRKSSDTMRKGMLLLVICLGLAVVFALLMLQPMLERYYSSFTASSTVASLNHSIEEGVVRRLMQIPWFGGWNIQVIAVRRAHQ